MKRKPSYVGTEEAAARKAKASRRTLLHICTRDSGKGAFLFALNQGYHHKDLWVVKFPDGSWSAFEAITRQEERNRLSGDEPDRRGEVKTREMPDPPKDALPPRVKWMGLSACTIIRLLASEGVSVVDCIKILPRIGLHDINPSTFKIQHRQGRRGLGLPKLNKDQCKALNIARKGNQKG